MHRHRNYLLFTKEIIERLLACPRPQSLRKSLSWIRTDTASKKKIKKIHYPLISLALREAVK